VIDLLSDDAQATADFVELLVFLVLSPVVIGWFVGRAIPAHFAIAIFCVGTPIIAFLAYRWYQSQVDYCKDFPTEDGDKLSCLDAGNVAAYNAGNFALLLAELGLATILVVGLVRWWKQRRSERPRYLARSS
jgi:hypothetical protein